MKTPDDYTEWLKRQIEENPQEPPAEAWERIAESLDLEGAWQGINQDLELDSLWQTIDQRLLQADKVFWWHKAGTVLTSVALMLFTLLPLLPALEEDKLLAEEPAPAHRQTTHTPDKPEETLFPKPAAGSTAATSGSAAGSGKQTAAQPKVLAEAEYPSTASFSNAEASETSAQDSPTGSERSGLPAASVASSGTAAEGLAGQNEALLPEPLEQGSVGQFSRAGSNESQSNADYLLVQPAPETKASATDIAGTAQAETLVVPSVPLEEETVIAKKSLPTAGWRLGIGGAARMSYLLNEKTFRGMEKSSLTTSLPAFRKSFSLQAERVFSPKLALLTELVVHHEAGQRYEEYYGGIYGTTDTRLRYSQLNALLAYTPQNRAFSNRPHTRWLAGLSGGWLHEASLSGPFGTTDLTDEYTKHTAGMLLGFEYVVPLAGNIRMGYGLRGYMDLLNIYAGTAEIPPHFRVTRSASLDFTLSFKYELRK